MADSVPFREKYGSRFLINAALLTAVSSLAWLWFTAHVKPHVSTLLFGSVSVATFGGVAVAVLGTFIPKGDALKRMADWLPSKKATLVLVALLPAIVFAFLTTFTLTLSAADGAGDVKLNVARGTSSSTVALTAAEKQKAVSYFLAFRPVTVRIATLVPSGFNTRELPLRRGLSAQLTVPDGESRKTFHLVRLMPLDNLFHLRGRKEPDQQYLVRLFVPGRRDPIERHGLDFHAIYLGASLPDLQAQSKSARALIADLRERLGAMDIPAEQIDAILTEWLDTPELIETPELHAGDHVRVVVESPAGKTETTVKVAAQVNNGFLQGAEQ